MKITIQSVHFNASEQLKEFTMQKVGKLDRFFDGIIAADVILSLDKADNTENKVSKIALSVPNDTLVAEKQCKTFTCQDGYVKVNNICQESDLYQYSFNKGNIPVKQIRSQYGYKNKVIFGRYNRPFNVTKYMIGENRKMQIFL